MNDVETGSDFASNTSSKSWDDPQELPSINASLATVAMVLVCLLIGMALWIAGDVLLLIFTGWLLALLLINLSQLFKQQTRLSYHWSLAIVIGALTVALVLLASLFATRLAGEANDLFETVKSKWQDLSAKVQQYPWAPKLDGAQSLSSLENIKGDWVSRIAGWFTSTFGLFSSLIRAAEYEQTAATPKLVRRLRTDRDQFIAEVRSRYES